MLEISQPLTNAQMEILKAFSCNLKSDELDELKDLLANFFANKAIEGADKVWKEKGWTDNDVDRMLNTKMRKSKQ